LLVDYIFNKFFTFNNFFTLFNILINIIFTPVSFKWFWQGSLAHVGSTRGGVALGEVTATGAVVAYRAARKKGEKRRKEKSKG
jgi:hypothetical protein